MRSTDVLSNASTQTAQQNTLVKDWFARDSARCTDLVW